MKKSKKKKYTVKTRSRMFVFFMMFAVVISILGYRLFSNLYQIMKMKNEKTVLESEIVSLNDEKPSQVEDSIDKVSHQYNLSNYIVNIFMELVSILSIQDMVNGVKA